MKLSIKQFRSNTKSLVDSLLRGEKGILTYRGRAIARLLPIAGSATVDNEVNPAGFGMWKDHSKTKDVSQWLDQLRKDRQF